MKIDHIVYLSYSIEKSIKEFSQFGFVQETEIYIDNIPDENNSARNVYICFIKKDNIRVELVSPIDENSDVYSTIKRQGEGPYHICYQVDNLEDKIRELKSNGWMVLKRPAKALAFNYARVSFLFKKSVGMIELVEGYTVQ